MKLQCRTGRDCAAKQPVFLSGLRTHMQAAKGIGVKVKKQGVRLGTVMKNMDSWLCIHVH